MKLPRMSGTAVWTLALCLIVFVIAPQQLAIAAYKLFLITLAGVAGYWIDREIFPYARPDTFISNHCNDIRLASAMLRRAIIVAAAMIAVGLGL
ncbi:MAG: putative holin [Pseudomonadota bacterium]